MQVDYLRRDAVEVLRMKHGRMKLCFCSSGCDRDGKSACLFAQHTSMEAPEPTPPSEFRKREECVSVFTRELEAFIRVKILCRRCQGSLSAERSGSASMRNLCSLPGCNIPTSVRHH